MRITGTKETLRYSPALGGKETLMNGPMHVEVRKRACQLYGLRYQPTPLHDYINFKQMSSGNEVLLNLENHEHFSHSELLGGLIELANRDEKQEFEWMTHPITASALQDLKSR